MSVRMVDLDSSCDDVELVELDSSVELVSVSGGESEGQVSPPRSQVLYIWTCMTYLTVSRRCLLRPRANQLSS